MDVEAMATYGEMVDATLPHGVMPAVVPQLKSITIGGAVSGIGIESSSFRYGLPHETVLSMDILNSYGTLGYAIRLRIATVPVKAFVRLKHHRHNRIDVFFQAMRNACDDAQNDFVDATIFDPDFMVLTTGRFCDEAPQTSDYTWMNMYFQSLRQNDEDCLTVKDYLWRWDTDWFWCSKNVYAQHALIRLIAGRRFLNSTTYQKIMRFNNRWGLLAKIDLP